MKNFKRVVLLPFLFLLAFSSVSYANSSSITATVMIPPAKLVITIISPKNTTYYKDCVPLTFTINKPSSSIKSINYTLDNQKNKTITKNITLTELSEGTHNITVYVADKSGNKANSTTVYFTIAEKLLGSVDIGKMSNGMADLSGWSKPQPKTSGGSVWGGMTGSYWRTVSCKNCMWGDSAFAYVISDGNAKTISIEHLDGMNDIKGVSNDSFNVYVLNGWNWVNIGSYKGLNTGAEKIVTTNFTIPSSVHTYDWIEVKITLTGNHWKDYNTYGQLAIHKIEALGVAECNDEHDEKQKCS